MGYIQDLEKEFKCKSPSDKALVDLIANSYVRKLSYSRKLETTKPCTGKDYDRYREFLSKEVDRAHRQFLSALEMLRAIKQPKLNLRVTNAFLAHQQQINTKRNGENIEPK